MEVGKSDCALIPPAISASVQGALLTLKAET